MIGIKFDKAIRPFVLIMPEMSGYIKIFKVKDRDKHKNNILMSFHRKQYINVFPYRQWETIGIIWSSLPVYDDIYKN